ncbi:MAG: hypothetical protein HUU47_05585 [Bacteroidetes bacterium]|nr:hypothetical protein [Bacteroidota bacterium]
MNITTEKLLKEFVKDHDLVHKITELTNSNKSLIEKINETDKLSASYNINDDIAELIYDIVLFDFFDNLENKNPNIFETTEWQKTEEKLLDRGTELFNILLYLRECSDNDFEISIDDYIDEFLMCEDDFDNQDALFYEDILKNREQLQNSDLNTWVEIATLNFNGQLESQLLPILMFFLPSINTDQKIEIISQKGKNVEFQKAFLSILNKFKNINNINYEHIYN